VGSGTFWCRRPLPSEPKVRKVLADFAVAQPEVTGSLVRAGVDLDSLGPRLVKYLEENAGEFEGLVGNGVTIVHGDFKAANLFFRDKEERVAMVDFQWVGRGRPTFDLVYFILSSVAPEHLVLEGDPDEDIVRKYADLLNRFSPQNCPSVEELISEYRKVFLHFVGRSVLDGAWDRFSCEFEKRSHMLGAAGYNKSVGVAAFLLWKAERLLKSTLT
jgi:hypothetical protein